MDRDADEVNDECGDNDDDDEDAEDGDYLVQQRSGDLIGGGSKQPPRKRQHHNNNDASYKFEEERNIRRAMPEKEGTLGNWTLHGQNLGTMLKNYKRQCRHLPPNHRTRSILQYHLDSVGHHRKHDGKCNLTISSI